VADENQHRRILDEPSTEDFEAAEQVDQPSGAGAVVFRILRVAGVLLLIVALLLYFVMPFRDVVVRVLHQWNLPLQSLPLAPEHKTNPKLPA